MQRIDFRDQISRNKTKSFFLILIVILFIVGLGYIISLAFSPIYFSFIMIIAIIFSIFYIMVGYYNSHKIAIASVGAKPALNNFSSPSEFCSLNLKYFVRAVLRAEVKCLASLR